MGAETPPPAGQQPDGNQQDPAFVTEDRLRDTLAGWTGNLLQKFDERLQQRNAPIEQFNALVSQYQQAAQDPQFAQGQQAYQPAEMDDFVPRRELVEQQQRFQQALEERDRKLREEFDRRVQPVVATTQQVRDDQEWQAFSARYPDLAAERRLVRAIAQDGWQSQAHVLQNMTPDQILDRFAREARAEINRYRGGQAAATPPPTPQAVTPGMGVTEPGVTPEYDLNDLDAPLNDEADIKAHIDARRKVNEQLAGQRI